jgi:hypothetical protein
VTAEAILALIIRAAKFDLGGNPVIAEFSRSCAIVEPSAWHLDLAEALSQEWVMVTPPLEGSPREADAGESHVLVGGDVRGVREGHVSE